MTVRFKNLPNKPTHWPFLRGFYYLAEETPCHHVMHVTNLEYISLNLSHLVKHNATSNDKLCVLCEQSTGGKCHCHGMNCKQCFPEQFCDTWVNACGEEL